MSFLWKPWLNDGMLYHLGFIGICANKINRIRSCVQTFLGQPVVIVDRHSFFGNNLILFDLTECKLNGFFVRDEPDFKSAPQVVKLANDLHLHAVHHVLCKGVRYRGYKVQPVGGEAWSHYWYDQDSSAQFPHFSKLHQHLFIGDCLGAGNIIGLIKVGFR